ncbi:MAG: hypothetical protein R3190_07725, partial [Thermoanaerobaculia bacterium]|nr:hypothetical protein [Thermoanaerobaculia bacterium]
MKGFRSALLLACLVAMVGPPRANAVDVAGERIEGASPSMRITVEDLESLPARSFDELLMKLPKTVVRESTPGVAPDGWSGTVEGANIRFRGPSATGGYFSIDAPRGTSLPSSARVDLFSAGRRIYGQKLDFRLVERVEVLKDVQGIYSAPGRWTPGGYLHSGPIDDDYRAGTWDLHLGRPDGTSIPAERWGIDTGSLSGDALDYGR